MIKFFTLFCCIIVSHHLLAQVGIQTENNFDSEGLIKNAFIKGDCKNVSNITVIGNETLSIGQFKNGGSSININSGIILTTGTVELAQGPNLDPEASFAFSQISNDADLNQLATSDLFDATGIEFDFVPLSNKVSFRYVFASEEYCEFVGTAFNDVFGFFVSGPGINGPYDNNAINVAKLISTDEDVSINNVNHLFNEAFYVSNVTNLDAEACNINHTTEYEDYIEYDGFTVPLVASFAVVPCETYHIRIIIGDVGDPYLDSGVFLETNSFDLGEPIIVHAEVPGSDEAVAYENCVDAQFVFTRSSLANINQDYKIDYNISQDSKAGNGIDFLEIPLSVTIPAGDTSFILPITIIDDNIAEGPENLKLEVSYACECIDPASSELIINDRTDIALNFQEIAVCENQPFSITPDILGGVQPFTFLWETGATTDSLTESVLLSSQFGLTVTDFCENTATAVADVSIQDVPKATLEGIYNLCETKEMGIPVLFEGNPPWSIIYSINDIEQSAIEDIQSNPYYLATPEEGVYSLSAFNDDHCTGQVMGSAVVESTFKIASEIIQQSCVNKSDGSIEITQLEAISPFTIEWNIETENDHFLENLEEGIYILKIKDGDDCYYQKPFKLESSATDITACFPFYIPNIFSPNNDGVNDLFSIYLSENSGVKYIISMQVFNRWGALLFEQSNFNPNNGTVGWNGNYNGSQLQSGTYVYKIIVGYEDGINQTVSGDITLVR